MTIEHRIPDTANMERQCPFCDSTMDGVATLCSECGKFSRSNFRKPGRLSAFTSAMVIRLSRDDIPVRREVQATVLIGLIIALPVLYLRYNSTDARFARACDERRAEPLPAKPAEDICYNPELGRYLTNEEKEGFIAIQYKYSQAVRRLKMFGEHFDENGNIIGQ